MMTETSRVDAAQEAVERRVEQGQMIRLSIGDQQAFVAAILDPPEPSAGLRLAFDRRNELFVLS
jgi:uncharacterized protein (DUF1778 family)